MATSINEFEFVNRTEELATLRSRVQPQASGSALTFLRSPSGYGKTRLTSRLIEACQASGIPAFVIVEPAIRTKSRSDRIYAWFYVQRAADPAAQITSGAAAFRSFADYVRYSRMRHLNWRHIYENLKEVASLSKLVRLLVELLENIMKRGRYSPENLLQDDGGFSTSLARDYVSALARDRSTTFIIRECQNIDPESLQFFLSIGDAAPGTCVIFEYTTADGKFLPEHEKIIFESVSAQGALVIYNLLRLDLKEFRSLLRKYAPVDKTLEAAVELSWDGNLRIIKALNFDVMTSNTTASRVPRLAEALREGLAALRPRAKLLLAIVTSNVEAVPKGILVAAIRKIENPLSASEIDRDLRPLLDERDYVQEQGGHYRLADEDLADAVRSAPAMIAAIRLADTSLRDVYLEAVDGGGSFSVPMQSALRQAMALCARTGDITSLRRLIATFSSKLSHAQDQALYVGMVADAILSSRDLFEQERCALINWAAPSAYEVGDFSTSAALIETLETPTAFHLALLACCYGEINRHEDALRLADRLEGVDPASLSIICTSQLIRLASNFALGRRETALSIFEQLIGNSNLSNHRLIGFIHRYAEIVFDFPKCTPLVLKSIKELAAEKFEKAAAYSGLAAAMHIAYEGKTDEATRFIDASVVALAGRVRDRAIILNNTVVVALLSNDPNFEACIDKLNEALFVAGDSFYRFVLHSNLLICYWRAGDLERARRCADILEGSMITPGFGNRDVFWTACYNAWSFFSETKDSERADKFKSAVTSLGFEGVCYPSYWRYRFGFSDSVAPEFSYLLQFNYHPEYLSHWVIDLEGLELLKEVSPLRDLDS